MTSPNSHNCKNNNCWKCIFLPFLLIFSWMPDQQYVWFCYFRIYRELFSYTLKSHLALMCVLFWIWVLFGNKESRQEFENETKLNFQLHFWARTKALHSYICCTFLSLKLFNITIKYTFRITLLSIIDNEVLWIFREKMFQPIFSYFHITSYIHDAFFHSCKLI